MFFFSTFPSSTNVDSSAGLADTRTEKITHEQPHKKTGVLHSNPGHKIFKTTYFFISFCIATCVPALSYSVMRYTPLANELMFPSSASLCPSAGLADTRTEKITHEHSPQKNRGASQQPRS